MTLFEWDEHKAETNRDKHGVNFEDATEVFYDPNALVEQDRVVDGELRWQTLGMVEGAAIVAGGPCRHGGRRGRGHPYHLGSTGEPQGAKKI